MSVLFEAVRSGSVEAVRSALSASGPDALRETDAHSFSAIHVAALEGNADVVRCLVLEGGSDPAAVTRRGETPLSLAARRGSLAVVRTLCELGCRVGQAGNGGNEAFSALFVAAERNHPAVVRFLIEMGANARQNSSSNWSPLSVASHFGFLEVCQCLLDVGGVPPDESDGAGRRPLLLAVRNGHAGVVKALLATGADCNRPPNEGGMSPVQVAEDRSHEECVLALLEGGCELPPRTMDDSRTLSEWRAGEHPLQLARLAMGEELSRHLGIPDVVLLCQTYVHLASQAERRTASDK